MATTLLTAPTALRVASFNTYLISRCFNNNRETFPERRALQISNTLLSGADIDVVVGSDGNECPPHSKYGRRRPIDLLFCQEVWGVGLPELTSNIQRTNTASDKHTGPWHYQVPHNRSPWIFWQSAFRSDSSSSPMLSPQASFLWSELFHTIYLHYQKTGGLYDFVLKHEPMPLDIGVGGGDDGRNVDDDDDDADYRENHNNISRPFVGNLECLHRTKHTFTVSKSKSRKGVEATLWSVPQWNSEESTMDSHNSNTGPRKKRRLLVFNTHLDPTAKYSENRQHQIHEIVDFMRHTLEEIATEDDEDADWCRTGVLIVGDFNIQAGTHEYHNVLMSDKEETGWFVRDLFWEEGETPEGSLHQHTYAWKNSLAIFPDDCGRIDYMLAVDRFLTTDYRSYNFMPLKAVSKCIREEPVGEESSDHYALIVDLVPA